MSFLSTDGTNLTWFTKPLGLETATKTHVLSVSTAGTIRVSQLSRVTGAVVTTSIEGPGEIDDHRAFGLARRSDDRLVALWGNHELANKPLRCAISTNPDDSTAWGAPFDLLTAASGDWTYANIFHLSAEGGANGRHYVFVRDQSAGIMMRYFYTDDDFASIVGPFPFLQCVNTADFPYTVFGSNNIDRIDFASTLIDVSTSPPLPDEAHLDVFHGYFMAGKAYKSDGTLIATQGVSGFPMSMETDLTEVYNSVATGTDAWVWDVVTNGGFPQILFVTFPDLATTNVGQLYNESTWSGSAWPVETVIAVAGGPPDLTTNDRHYSCGASFNDNTADSVVAACGTYMGSRVVRMEKSAGVWSEAEVLAGSNQCQQVNLRPITPLAYGASVSPRCREVWLDGNYNSFSQFKTTIRFASDVVGMAAAGWTGFVVVTLNHGQVVGGPHGDFTGIITQANPPAGFWAVVQADGGDIRVSLGATATGGGEYTATNVLPCELVAWDYTNQFMELHINHPEASSAVDRQVVLWCGATGKTLPSALRGTDADGWPGSQAIWHPQVFSGVYHWNEASGPLNDATFNGNSFAAGGAPTYRQTGMFGTALSAIYLPNDTASFSAGKLVGGGGGEGWINAINGNASHLSYVVANATEASNVGYDYTIEDSAGTPHRLRVGRNGGGEFAVTNAPTGFKYVYYLPTSAGGFSTGSARVNQLAEVTAATGAPGAWDRTRFGGIDRSTDVQQADLVLDEFRLFTPGTTAFRSGQRTLDYSKTEAANGANPGAFWTAGPLMPLGGTGTVVFRSRGFKGGPGLPQRGRPGQGGVR